MQFDHAAAPRRSLCGTLLTGGAGTIAGTVAGVLLLGVIRWSWWHGPVWYACGATPDPARPAS